MPQGLPSAAALMEQRAVTFFSIDTDVIQSLGYRFSEGALHALALQRPSWIQGHVTEVVEREVIAHRMEPVLKAVQELRSSIASVQRLAGQDLGGVKKSVDELDTERATRNRFSLEFRNFLFRLGGSVLSLDGETLARQMFTRYFEQRPPFEQRKDKKSEFPDAAALLVLENHAEQQKTQGVLISKDGGWAKFANESDRLYCVTSLEAFTALFESTGENADSVKDKLKQAFSDYKSDLSLELEQILESHVAGAFWIVDDVYSGFSLRVEAEVNGVGYAGSHLDPDSLSLWFVEHDPSMCTVEITVSVSVDLDIGIDFLQYDSIDHDEVRVGSHEVARRVDIGVDVFLICRGDLLNMPVEKWDISFDISGDDYRVDVGEVNPDFGDEE